MSKIQQFAQELESEVEAIKADYAEKQAEVVEKLEVIKARDAKSKKKAMELSLREDDVAARESSIEKKLAKIATDEEIKKMSSEAGKKMELAEKTLKQGNLLLAEAKARQEDVAKKQLALQQEKGEYKAKLKQEFVDSLMKR